MYIWKEKSGEGGKRCQSVVNCKVMFLSFPEIAQKMSVVYEMLMYLKTTFEGIAI